MIVYAALTRLLVLAIFPLNVVNGQKRKPLSGTPQILNGEVTHFLFDPYYTMCKLLSFEHFFVKKYTIEQGQEFEGDEVDKRTVVLVAALDRKTLDDKECPEDMLKGRWIGNAQCTRGNVNMVKTGRTKQTGVPLDGYRCGLATLLTYLCLVDGAVQGKNTDDEF